MFCVFFEVEPRAGQADTYFRLAMGMRAEVEKIDGFLSVERFADLERPGAFLSFSTWRDEKALIRWRTVGKHQMMQQRGRSDIFAAYRIRIGELTDGTELLQPPAQFRFDETETGAAKSMLFAEFPTDADAPDSPEALSDTGFRAVLTPEKSARLSGWPDAARAAARLDALRGVEGVRARSFRIVRDYTMVDRTEAPQFFPPVAPL